MTQIQGILFIVIVFITMMGLIVHADYKTKADADTKG
jgi:hypothetical protein